MSSSGSARASRLGVVASVAALLATACGSSDGSGGAEEEQRTLRFASYQFPTSGPQVANTWWAERLEQESGGSLRVEMFDSASLLDASESIAGVADGRADISWVSLVNHPDEVPLGGITQVPGIGSPNSDARMLALYEMSRGEGGSLAESFSRNGVTVVAATPISPLIFGFQEPVESVSDLAGKRIRASGAIGEAFATAGAQPVALPLPEVYESLQRGVVDAWSGASIDVAYAQKFQEVAPHLLEVKELQGIGDGLIVMRSDLYEELSDAQRDAIAETWEAYKTEALEITRQREEEACQGFIDEGGSVISLDDAERSAWIGEIGDTLIDQFVQTASSGDIDEADVRAFVDEFAAKTESLAEGTDYMNPIVACAETYGG